jgi:hypothetical protein
MSDHPWEAIVAVLAIIGGIVVWSLKLEGRLTILEKAMAEHLQERQAWTEQLTMRLDRMERKLDTIRLRCQAFHHLPVPSLEGEHDRDDG